MHSRNTRTVMRIVLAAFLVATGGAMCRPAYGGTITTGTVAPNSLGGTGAVNNGNPITTPSPMNDEVAGQEKSNTIRLRKTFTSIQPIDITFTVADTAGATATEYYFDDRPTNNTGKDWTDFKVEIGFGTGAQFKPVRALQAFNRGGGLDLDAAPPNGVPSNTPAPESNSFKNPPAVQTFDGITWQTGSGFGEGGVPDGGSDLLNFSADVPNSGAVPAAFQRDANNDGRPDGFVFTVRQTPSVAPLPPAAWPGLGLLGVLGGIVAARALRDARRAIG